MIFSKKDVHSNDNVDALRLINDNTPFAINEAFSPRQAELYQQGLRHLYKH